MRNMKIRAFMLYFIIIAFFVGLSFFTYEFIKDGKSWAFSNVNRHLYEGKIPQGKVIDRNGEILSANLNGKRIYNDDEQIRKAMLHTVGDGFSLIPTSVQSILYDKIFGYNMITGFGAPENISSVKDVVLTLDSNLCAKVSNNFKGKKGTAIAYNYLTGEILCLVSLPTYDVYNKPNTEELKTEKYDGVYLNRALSSSYTPGSVFKLFTTAAALDSIEDIEKRKFLCEKIKMIDGEKVSCMKNHGKINLKDALCKSCDIVFCDIAIELGREKMMQKMNEYGFNKENSFEGLKLSKSRYCVDEKSTNGDLGWSGIGQYTNTLNPLHMLKFMGAIANGGICVEPYLVKKDNLVDENLNSVQKTAMLSPRTADKLKEFMRYTVKNNYGDSKFPNMCAKTGTAEVGEGKLPHGWMVGFSNEKSFPIAFVVVVENGDFGISCAGPIVSEMIKSLKNEFKSGGYM